MKNKYFDQLKEEAELEDELEVPEENLLPVSPEEDRKKLKKTVTAVYAVMAFLFAAEFAVVLFFVGGPVGNWTNGKWQAVLGLVLGAAFGAVWFATLKIQTERAVEAPETQSKRKIRAGAIIRYVVLLLLLTGALLTGWANPVLIIIGVLNMKLAAYAAGFFLSKKGVKDAQ